MPVSSSADIGRDHRSPVDHPVFLYDLASPWCWIAAEHVNSALDSVPEWRPVLMSELAPDAYAALANGTGRDAIAAAAPMPPRWPDPLPADSGTAMLAATFAKKSGRAVAFSLAAFRQAFAAGRDLGETDNVLIAAAACELHPRALLKGVETAAVRNALAEATADAAAQGVDELPAVVVDGRVFAGPRAVEEAATS
jgi:2-hydroxychromene-2-carboxylate isomerase